MPKIDVERLVPYDADAMLDLVADVERYPEFMPYVLETHSRPHADPGSDHLDVSLVVGYARWRESASIDVLVDRRRRRIDIRDMGGPFREMRATWTFEPTDDGGCRIGVRADYALSSKLLQMAVSAGTRVGIDAVVKAYVDRAREIAAGRSS